MKKLLLSVSVIVIFAFYSSFQKRIASLSSQGQGSTFPDNQTPTTPGIGNRNRVTYKDGVYTGNTEDAYYGYVQVQIAINGEKITNITFLQYPNDRQRSQEINNQAISYLKQEAISAQSANVNIVSGATATSQAFIASLKSALNQAS